MPVVSTTPYGPVSTNADQQIMAIAIATNIINRANFGPVQLRPFTGEIKDVRITFNDGRYMYMT